MSRDDLAVEVRPRWAGGEGGTSAHVEALDQERSGVCSIAAVGGGREDAHLCAHPPETAKVLWPMGGPRVEELVEGGEVAGECGCVCCAVSWSMPGPPRTDANHDGGWKAEGGVEECVKWREIVERTVRTPHACEARAKVQQWGILDARARSCGYRRRLVCCGVHVEARCSMREIGPVTALELRWPRAPAEGERAE